MKTFYLKTYGCQQNISDSERIRAVLEKAGFVETEDMRKADLILANTCSVRKHAEDKAYGFLRNAHDLRKEKRRIVGITGCMIRKTSTRDSEKKDKILNKSKYLDFVFRIEDTPSLVTIIKNIKNRDVKFCVSITKIGQMDNFFSIKPKLKKPFFSLVPIMSGCNQFCTYCIVPYARGRERSRNMQDVIEECKKLANEGVVEIQLLGQNVNAYKLQDNNNKWQGSDFAYLLNEIAKINGLKRIRFTSPHPSGMTNDVIDVMAENKNICNQMHLPVQSGSNDILRKMNRPYVVDDFKKITRYARKKMPNLAISTDLIVGFPGETEDDFLKTKQLCLEEKFDMIYFSKYSSRPGTAAVKMNDNILLDEKKRRANIIQNVLLKTSLENNKKLLNQTVEVLIEEIKDGTATAKTEGWKTVHFPTKSKPGEFVKVKINEATSWFLKGEGVN